MATNHYEVTAPVTVAGRTEPVAFEFTVFESHTTSGYSKPIFTGHIGRGGKTHKVSAHLIALDSVQAGQRLGYRVGTVGRPNGSLVEVDGKLYGIKLEGHALNRQVRIDGWVADAAATSAHIMER